MAANRIDPSQGAAETPAEAPSQGNAPATAGGIKAWLPLLITVLLMPALAYAMTSFVLLPRLQKGLGITAAAADTAHPEGKDAKANKEKRESVTMTKLLVNVAGTMGARYLLVSLNIVGAGDGFSTKMTDLDPQLRDMAQGALRSKTLADLEKPGAVNLIRTELISGFNGILGGPFVKEIYVTEFAIQ